MTEAELKVVLEMKRRDVCTMINMIRGEPCGSTIDQCKNKLDHELYATLKNLEMRLNACLAQPTILEGVLTLL